MRGAERQTIEKFFRLFCNHDYEKIDFYEAMFRTFSKTKNHRGD